jgi:transcriptional regulator with XRE-family HTH domain
LQMDPSSTGSEAFAQRLREARTRLGWSLSEAAERTGLSRAYINALERGRGKRPGADAVRQLEDVFGPLRAPDDREFVDAPPGLRALARERHLPEAEVRVLAGLRIRGRQPLSMERWRFIYDALLASEQMDAEDSPRA